MATADPAAGDYDPYADEYAASVAGREKGGADGDPFGLLPLACPGGRPAKRMPIRSAPAAAKLTASMARPLPGPASPTRSRPSAAPPTEAAPRPVRSGALAAGR
jgi:hypothetical protein